MPSISSSMRFIARVVSAPFLSGTTSFATAARAASRSNAGAAGGAGGAGVSGFSSPTLATTPRWRSPVAAMRAFSAARLARSFSAMVCGLAGSGAGAALVGSGALTGRSRRSIALRIFSASNTA